jgi:hypothetical protein
MSRHRDLAVLALIGLLTSCADQEQAVPSATPSAAVDLPLYPANPASDGAFLDARLVSERDCLYLEAHGDRWLAIWPSPGTSWNRAAVRVHGSVVTVGNQASFGGGETDLIAADLASYDLVNEPRHECLVGKAWWVSQIISGH